MGFSELFSLTVLLISLNFISGQELDIFNYEFMSMHPETLSIDLGAVGAFFVFNRRIRKQHSTRTIVKNTYTLYNIHTYIICTRVDSIRCTNVSHNSIPWNIFHTKYNGIVEVTGAKVKIDLN